MNSQQINSANTIQALIDNTPAGGKLVLQTGEYCGPFLITRPIAIEGNRSTLWCKTGPVLEIAAEAVILRDLCVEVTCYQDASPALIVQENFKPRLENVSVRGEVEGLDGETGDWQLPTGLELGILAPRRTNSFRLRVSVPVHCRLNTKLAGVTCHPSKLDPGQNEIRIDVSEIPSEAYVQGCLEVQSANLIREISVSGTTIGANDVAPVSQLLLWEPVTENGQAKSGSGDDSWTQFTKAVSEYIGLGDTSPDIAARLEQAAWHLWSQQPTEKTPSGVANLWESLGTRLLPPVAEAFLIEVATPDELASCKRGDLWRRDPAQAPVLYYFTSLAALDNFDATALCGTLMEWPFDRLANWLWLKVAGAAWLLADARTIARIPARIETRLRRLPVSPEIVNHAKALASDAASKVSFGLVGGLWAEPPVKRDLAEEILARCVPSDGLPWEPSPFSAMGVRRLYEGFGVEALGPSQGVPHALREIFQWITGGVDNWKRYTDLPDAWRDLAVIRESLKQRLRDISTPESLLAAIKSLPAEDVDVQATLGHYEPSLLIQAYTQEPVTLLAEALVRGDARELKDRWYDLALVSVKTRQADSAAATATNRLIDCLESSSCEPGPLTAETLQIAVDLVGILANSNWGAKGKLVRIVIRRLAEAREFREASVALEGVMHFSIEWVHVC